MSENEKVESVEVVEPSTEQVAEPSVEESPVNSTMTTEEIGKVIAGVKKKFKEKGRQEGLQEAQRLVSGELPMEEPASPEPSSTPPSSPGQPGVDPVWANKAQTIYAQGCAKHGDFAEKYEASAKKASSNPTLLALYQYAIGVGDADAVYSIMTNGAKRAKMLEDPNCWQTELFKANSTPAADGAKMPPPPLDDLKTAPAKGERNRADQKRYILEKHGVWRGS